MSEGRDRPVVVCGAGAAGMAAAIAAARTGRHVKLIELASDVGGTMADSLLHTIAGLYDSEGQLINEGLARELVERLTDASPQVVPRRMGRVWVLSVDPNLYRQVAREWVAGEPNIDTRLLSRVTVARTEGPRVAVVEISDGVEVFSVPVRSVVDATGGASFVGVLGPDLSLPESEVAAGGWVFRVRGVEPGAFDFPRNLGVVRALRERAAEKLLPAECEMAWIDRGIHADEVFVKLFIPLDAGWRRREEHGDVSGSAQSVQNDVFEFMRSLEGFEQSYVSQTGRLGVRDGGRVRGDYTLTEDDVLGLRKFDDAACRCAWPIEYWDSRRGVSLTYLPDGGHYEIPMRSLKVSSFWNVWVAGKNLSADLRAQASARCVGTCWAMGAAAGHAAATCPEAG